MKRASTALLAIRLLIGGLFLATAALKVWSPAESAAVAVAYDIPPLVTAIVIQVELFLAALLLFGCWTRQALTASAILFALFGMFSIYRGLAGYESCGCFGSLKVNPWMTVVLDAWMFAAATWGAWKLAPSRELIQPWRLYGAGGCYAMAAIIAAAGMMAHAPTKLLQAEDMHPEAGGLIILEPEKWIGQPFPLTEHLTPSIDLTKGRWILLFYHHDCPHCQEALPQYERLAAAANNDRIALIETPPFGAAPTTSEGMVRAHLSDLHEWFMQTPVEIIVEEGIVMSASLDLPAVSSGLSLFPKVRRPLRIRQSVESHVLIVSLTGAMRRRVLETQNDGIEIHSRSHSAKVPSLGKTSNNRQFRRMEWT